MKLSIALLITLSRIAMTPCIVWCVMMHHWTWAAILFAVAVSTDFLDGFVARKYNQESRLGQLLDPVADKILIISLMYSLILGNNKDIFWYYGLFFIIKEIILFVGAAVIYVRYDIYFKPTLFSRVISVSEMLIIFLVLIDFGKNWKVLWYYAHISGFVLLSFYVLMFVMICWFLFLPVLSFILLLQYGVEIIRFLRKRL